MTAAVKILLTRETVEDKLVTLAKECLGERYRVDTDNQRYAYLTDLAKKLLDLAKAGNS